MSRAYKDSLVDLITDLGGTVTAPEKLSGADLEQMKLSVLNGDTATADADGKRALGVNASFPGNPNGVALTGSDLERFAGSQ